MKKQVLFLLIILYNLNSSAVYQDKANDDLINDGPYVFFVNDTLKVKMIENNILREYTVLQKNFSEIKTTIHLSCNYKDLINVYSEKPDYRQNFSDVDSIIAISDVHGQYKKYLSILQANGVIDTNLNWKFGKGHFVFLGDAFDRGDRVTELLWHLFTLEKQASKAGGRVHVLIGNHDNMELCGDLTYINEKYKKVEELTNTRYSDLYSENSVLGKWLRNKPVIVSINDMLYVHAGISIELPRNKLTIKKVNKLFSDKIIANQMPAGFEDEKLKLLDGDEGPLWYRGYFMDSTFSENKLDSILDFYSRKHIIVGHTTFKEMRSLYNTKIIGIDAGIGYTQMGEVLICKKGNFYRGSNKGERIKL